MFRRLGTWLLLHDLTPVCDSHWIAQSEGRPSGNPSYMGKDNMDVCNVIESHSEDAGHIAGPMIDTTLEKGQVLQSSFEDLPHLDASASKMMRLLGNNKTELWLLASIHSMMLYSPLLCLSAPVRVKVTQ